MKTKTLFGVQFAEKKHYKAQLLKDFDRWKLEKQWFLARERNQFDVVGKLVEKFDTEHIDDTRSGDEIFDELDQLLGRLIDEKQWQGLYDEFLGDAQAKIDINGGPDITRDEVKALFEESDCRHYYFTNTALQECKKLEAKTPLNLERLRPTFEGKRQLNFGHHFIRYHKQDSRIIALSANFTPRQECSYLQHTFFTFDLEKKIESPKLFCDHVAVLLEKNREELGNFYIEFDRFSHELLFKMIFFLDLAEVETIFLPAGRRHGTQGSDNHLRNQEVFDMTIVTANWNRAIQLDPVPVSQHSKWQHYGPGAKLKKRIDIESYFRRPYTVKAQKELEPA